MFQWCRCRNLWCRLLWLHKRNLNVESLLVLEGWLRRYCISVLFEWRGCRDLRTRLLRLQIWRLNVEKSLVLESGLILFNWYNWQCIHVLTQWRMCPGNRAERLRLQIGLFNFESWLMLVRLVYLTLKDVRFVEIDVEVTLRHGMSIRDRIVEAVSTEVNFIKFRVPTN